ncbi:MAG: menaquinone biosynthesis protein [Gemmatimonadota bacterium]|nr:menaquinone biosynthesis protein [Gemmatimonadota bacterium]
MTRVGRIGYVNCFPVYGAIDRGLVPCPAELVTGTPSELNGLLAASELDVSVVSAVEYARHADAYWLLPDLAVSSDGPVRSVVLFAKEPVERLDGSTVLVSASSRTSVQLLQMLALEVWGIAPHLVEARTEAADLETLGILPHDAVLVIGDAALLLAADSTYGYRYDLGAVWKDWTGLPFVFAVWAARRETPQNAVATVHRSLLASRAWGLDHLADLAREAAERTRLPERTCHEYLQGLDYALSYRHLEGLTSFFRRLAATGVVKDGTLRFLSVA